MKSVIRKQLPYRNSIACECLRQKGQEPLYPNEQYNKGLLLGLAENTLSCKMTDKFIWFSTKQPQIKLLQICFKTDFMVYNDFNRKLY